VSRGLSEGERRLRAGSGLTETILLPQSHFQQAEKKRGVVCDHTPLFHVAPLIS